MFDKYFILSVRNIKHRQLRSWLTIIGIIIGVALIVSLISLGKGMENTVLRQMQLFGTDLIIIFPGAEDNPLLGVLGGGSFRDAEVDIIEDVEGTRSVVPFDVSFLTVEFKGEEKSTLVHASPMIETEEVFTESQGFGVESGNWPGREDSNEVILGWQIAHNKFREEIFVGDTIRVKNKEFRVVGIFSEIGSSEDDNAIYMSLENSRAITGKRNTVVSIMARVVDGYDPEVVAEEIRYRLSRERGSEDFTVLTSAKAERIVGDVIGSIQLGVLFIAIFSIIVGGIGVMNTMYTSVLERRREIGIMKAIGATNQEVLNVFMIESGIIGFFGGLIGILLGLALAYLVELVAVHSGFKLLQVYISFTLVFGTLFFAFLVGVVSGVLPAREAAKLNPAEALRYE